MEHTSAPADLADLRRCLFLLDHVPEWQSRIGELEAVPGWENLAKNWQKLTDLFRLESPDLRGEAPETDQLLRSLTSKKETTRSKERRVGKECVSKGRSRWCR